MATINAHTGILTSPKFVPLTDGAFRLWCHGLMWSKEHLTDGFIPVGMLPSLHRQAVKLVSELLKVNVPGKGPLWHMYADGYRIHDYADWQDSATDVQTRRRKWREQKQGIRKVSTPEYKPDSIAESTPESNGESRSGVGGGCGSGGGGGGGGEETQTAPVARLVSSSASAQGMGSTHLAAQELVSLWNQHRRGAVVFADLQPDSKRILRTALTAKSLDTWERIFRRIESSDYLAGRLQFPSVGLFRAIELADRIAEGQYDNRQKPTEMSMLAKWEAEDAERAARKANGGAA